jgi:tetratricopeptide (TPR) repeat protein
VNTAPPQLTLPQALEWVVKSLQSGNLAEAERICKLILAADPRQVDALNLLGSVFLQRGDADGALERFARAAALDPTFADAHYNKAVALGALERWEEALSAYDAAIRIDPRHARAWNNRGNVLQKLERWEEALASYDRTLALTPRRAEALHNRGLVLLALARPRDALATFEAAVAIDPRLADAQWSKSHAHLILGEFEQGWPLQEWRWRTQDMAHLARDYPEPLWLGGESLEGKDILLWGDQGFGDALMMARYVPLAARAAAKVQLEVHPLLARLMRTLSPSIDVIAEGEKFPRFDMHCPLGSLPLAFRTTLETIPGREPYLRATPEDAREWADRLGPRTRKRIGIAWSGNPAMKADREKRVPLEELASLFGEDCEFHCVQTQFRPGDEEAARAAGVRLWGSSLRDFADTAALLENLDLVVTSDTAAAHLAGAIGRPTWILLAHVADQRWLLDRSDSPWYPTARLFRQPRRGDWKAVIAAVRAALRELPA